MKKETEIRRREFGSLLRRHRSQCGLSMADLGSSVGSTRQNIYSTEVGRRPCGPVLAEKLAQALALTGEERVEFLKKSAGTTERGKAPQIPGVNETIDALLRKILMEAGIQPSKIVNAQLAKRSSDRMHESPDLVVADKDGSSYAIEIKVRRIESGGH